MMKYIKDSLALSALVKSKMATDDLNQLEILKEQLKDRFGVPVGVHMTGIPLAVSTLLAIFATPCCKCPSGCCCFAGSAYPNLRL